MGIPKQNWDVYQRNAAPWTASKFIPATGAASEGRLTVAEYLQLIIGGPDAQACLNVCRAEVPFPCAFTVQWDIFLQFAAGSALAGRGPSGPVPRGLGFSAWTTVGTKPPLAGNGDALGCVIVRWFNDNHDGIIVADLAAGSVDIPAAKRVFLYCAAAGTMGGETGIMPVTVVGSIAMTEAPRARRVVCSSPQFQNDFSAGSIQFLGIPPRARFVRFEYAARGGVSSSINIDELILDGSGSGNGVGWQVLAAANARELATNDLEHPVPAYVAGYELTAVATLTKGVFRFVFECEP